MIIDVNYYMDINYYHVFQEKKFSKQDCWNAIISEGHLVKT